MLPLDHHHKKGSWKLLFAKVVWDGQDRRISLALSRISLAHDLCSYQPSLIWNRLDFEDMPLCGHRVGLKGININERTECCGWYRSGFTRCYRWCRVVLLIYSRGTWIVKTTFMDESMTSGLSHSSTHPWRIAVWLLLIVLLWHICKQIPVNSKE